MPNSFRRKSQSSVAASDQRRGRRAMPVKSKVAAHHATHARSPREGRARRAAYAQPRLLVLAMLVMLAASVWWAVAQSKKAASTKTAASSKSAAPTLNVPATNFQHPLTPRDIPAIVKTYAERRRIAAKLGLLKDKNGKYGTRRFNLTERDLTPYSASDEREPSYNPNGNFITFVSNGVDTNNDGQIDSLPSAGTPHYHVWIMNRDGSQQRQITGLQTGNLANGQPDPTKDGNRDQRTPTWSPDGNTIVYTDTGAFDSQRSVNPDPAVKTELSTVTNLFSATPTITRITFSGGNKLRPTWSPNGVVIAFAADTYPQRRSGSGPDDPNGAYNASGAYFPLATAPGSNPARSEYDIFLIAPTGVESTVRRLTGGSTDAAGNAADDLNPAYSIANSGQQIYFSSNRTNSGPLTNPARRIWRMNADGTTPQQVSDPTQRRDRIDNATVGSTVVGQATDTDDYPSPSANFGNGERVAFQSNSRIDTSDTTQDNNIWSLLVRGNSPEERSGNSAFVESNVTSSPAAFTQSGINAIGSDNQPINGKDGNGNPITEDKSDDREPGFARSTSGQAQLAELAFASDRRAGAQPGTINPAPRVTPTPLPTATPANPPGPTPTPIDPNNPIVVNGADGGNHDIWVTVSEDFTPPILLPQQTGNQVFPVLAPGPQAASANLTAPRTPEEGLQAGQPVTIAFVVQELESGLSNVHIDIIDAETSGYRFEPSPQGGPGNPQKVNASVAVNVNYETDPAIIDSIDSSNGGFVISDNGPPTEKQAGAVKGDGIYYVQTQYTPPLTQDYYFNIRLTDKQGNSFTYDHIWGFTNKAFTPASNFNSDLFVSDYTVGQRFPGLGGDPRYQTVGDQFGL
ncbi:MAG: PD40 domain-containing protein, partial [Abitibacteriaceae bacterium]|nr:PD40 domain-containing protein [Abditibacteriaceae bacterium]